MKRWLAVVMVISACGKKQPNLQEEVKKWEPKVGAKLAALSKIAAALSTVDAKPYTGPARRLVEDKDDKLIGDTLLTYRADLTAVVAGQSPPANYDRHQSSLTVPECWYIMKKGKLGSFSLSNNAYGEFEERPGSGFQVTMLCDDLEQAAYIAVVTPGTSSGGTADIPDDASKTADTFTGAVGTGTLDLFDASTGAYQGRLTYSARSSGSIQYKTSSTGAGASIDADQAIGKDMREQTWRAIETVLVKH